jgi:hypothetical protein
VRSRAAAVRCAAHYTGHGDSDRAESFECRDPT